MAGILDSMSTMLTPDMVGKLGKNLGIDPAMITKGLAVAGPLVTGTLAKTASTPEGAAGLTDMLTKAQAAAGQSAAAGQGDALAGLMGASGGDLSGALDGVMGLMSASGGTGADMMQGVMGQGINAISGTLSKSLGFDVQPMMKLAVPAVMGLVTKAMKSGNLDSAGVAKILKDETKAYTDNPANKATVDMIKEANAAGAKAAELQGKFSADEWKSVRLAPAAAAYLVVKASPSRGKGAAQEAAAMVGTVSDAVGGSSATSLLNTAFGGTGLTGDELATLEASAPTTEAALKTIKAAQAAVVAKTPGEVAAFKALLVSVAEGVAAASKEGGFLGLGGKQISDAEAAAVNSIKSALG